MVHARVLLKADQDLTDEGIAAQVEVGLVASLDPRRPDRPPEHKIDGDVEADLVALACSAPPEGRALWALLLLADKLV